MHEPTGPAVAHSRAHGELHGADGRHGRGCGREGSQTLVEGRAPMQNSPQQPSKTHHNAPSAPAASTQACRAAAEHASDGPRMLLRRLRPKVGSRHCVLGPASAEVAARSQSPCVGWHNHAHAVLSASTTPLLQDGSPPIEQH